MKNNKFLLPEINKIRTYQESVIHTADYLIYKTCITYSLLTQFFNFEINTSTVGNQNYYHAIHILVTKLKKINQSLIWNKKI